MGAQSAAGGLSGRIPGLAKHRTSPPPVTLVPSVPDTERAFALLKEERVRLETMYPEQAMEWLREFRTDVVADLKRIEAQVDAVVSGGDILETRRALAAYVEAHQRAFEMYTSRPPVVDLQGDLF